VTIAAVAEYDRPRARLLPTVYSGARLRARARRAVFRTPGATVTEILTESFCERCGTRYTFESNARRRGGLRRIRLLSRGVKHFVENDGSTVSEALEAARGDLARAASAEQIDAFHRTFNFCLGCRQYTCANCWNAAEGMCLSCAPDLSREVLPAPFPDLPLHPVVGTEATPSGEAAWPAVDVRGADVVAAKEAGAAPGAPPIALAATAQPAAHHVVPAAGEAGSQPARSQVEQPEPVNEAAPGAPATVDVEAPAIAGAQAPVEVEAPARVAAVAGADAEAAAAVAGAAPRTEADGPADEPAPVAAPATGADREPGSPDALTPDELALIAGALAARSAAAGAVAATPNAAGEGAPDDGPARNHNAVGRAQTRALLRRFRPARSSAATPAWRGSADAPPAPLPAPTARGGEPAVPTPAPLPITPAAPPRDDLVPQPTWSRVAPIGAVGTPGTPAPSIETPPAGTPIPGRAGPRPGRPAAGRPTAVPASPWAARLANARPEANVWAESSRVVLGQPGSAAPVGIQACVSCGLPLSATARFCRRCGVSQG